MTTHDTQKDLLYGLEVPPEAYPIPEEMSLDQLSLLSNMFGRLRGDLPDGYEEEIQNRIGNVDESTPLKDLLLLTLAVASITKDRSYYVSTSADLPDISNIAVFDIYEGALFYVEDDAVMVFCSGQKWIGLDSVVYWDRSGGGGGGGRDDGGGKEIG
jgi:hypothetical protein